MTSEQRQAIRWGWITVVFFLLLAAVLVAIGQEAKPTEKTAPKPLSQEEARTVNLLRQNWDSANARANASRQQYERDIEMRAEARLEIVAEVQRLRVKHQVPDGWVLDFEGMKWNPPPTTNNNPR